MYDDLLAKKPREAALWYEALWYDKSTVLEAAKRYDDAPAAYGETSR